MKYTILNLLALFAVLLLSFENYEIWTRSSEWAPEKESAKKIDKKPEPVPAPVLPKEVSNIKSYVAIAEKNIFNPERKDFPVMASSATPGEPGKRPFARPQIILYGITTFNDYQSATISVQGVPLRKGEREAMTIKPGEKVGEYQLTKVLPDRITLEAGEDSFEVLLYDPKMPKQRSHVKTEAKPAAVTSVSPTPAPAAPGAPPAPQQPPPAVATPASPIPTPKPASPAFAPSPVFTPRPIRPTPRRGIGGTQ